MHTDRPDNTAAALRAALAIRQSFAAADRLTIERLTSDRDSWKQQAMIQAESLRLSNGEVERLTAQVQDLLKGWAEECDGLKAEVEELNGLVGVNPRTLEHEISRLTAENERLQKLNACVTRLMQHPNDDDAYQRIAEAWLACNPNAQENL